MKALDRHLQRARIAQARKFVRKGDAILDIGSVDGVMFERWKGLIGESIGIDPLLEAEVRRDSYTLIPGHFPEAVPEGARFDAITMLAVLEHLPDALQRTLAERCYKLLGEKGRVIITVPVPAVDTILELLQWLRLIDGMSVEEHHGFVPADTTRIFSEGFRLLHHSTFQLGLNNLFVFEKL